MTRNTILYICDAGTSSNSALATLNAAGYAVVSTKNSTQAVALLFVMHGAGAIVVDQRTRKQPCFDLARRLWQIRPDVPIILLGREPVKNLPVWMSAYLAAIDPLEKLTSILQMMMNAEPATHEDAVPDSLPCAG
jgi:DNA-binding NtrC family response regulator